MFGLHRASLKFNQQGLEFGPRLGHFHTKPIVKNISTSTHGVNSSRRNGVAGTRRSSMFVVASTGAAAAPAPPPDNSGAAQPTPPTQPVSPPAQEAQLTAYHYVTFFVMLAGGLFFLSLTIMFTGDIEFQRAVNKVFRRLFKTVALRQVSTILTAMAFVRYGLEPVIKSIRNFTKAQGPWEKSSEYYILRELYKPLEFLFLIAAFTTLAENFLPQLLTIPKGIVQTVVRSTLSLTFVLSAARVVFNIKGRIVRESAWQYELKGDLTRQRRLEAFDKLLSVLTLIVSSVFGLQALGLDVNSVLAIGGVGGLAVGLAGREILENLFTGLIILSSNPFEVGDEVMFRPTSGQIVEGIVVDVGWYRTTIRSFEREVFNIPNSVFLRNVVLNITRKQREWRFYEFVGLRLEDLPKVTAVVSDIRKILRQDTRIIQKLHRRVFLDKLTRDECTIYISFYVEAANRDAFMAVKQDLLLSFVDCVERNGAKLARGRLQLEILPGLSSPMNAGPVVDIPMLPQPVDVVPGVVVQSTPVQSTSGSGGSSSSSTKEGSSSSKDSKETSAKAEQASNIVPTAASTKEPSTTTTTKSGSSPSSTKSPTATTTTTTTASGSPPQPPPGNTINPQAIASALSNNPKAIAALVSADEIFLEGEDRPTGDLF